eukprot:3336034-Karenia_brevis.AAC.1
MHDFSKNSGTDDHELAYARSDFGGTLDDPRPYGRKAKYVFLKMITKGVVLDEDRMKYEQLASPSYTVQGPLKD